MAELKGDLLWKSVDANEELKVSSSRTCANLSILLCKTDECEKFEKMIEELFFVGGRKLAIWDSSSPNSGKYLISFRNDVQEIFFKTLSLV